MKKEILIRPVAELEIAEAYRWYEERRDGLGNDFLLCMEESFEKIDRSPEQYPVVHREVRRALMRRFPYGIFYIHEKERIVVLSVFHGSRNPKDWMKRA